MLRTCLLVGVEGEPALEEAAAGPAMGGNDRPPVTLNARIRTPQSLQQAPVVLGPFAMVQKESLLVWLHSVESLMKLDVSSLLGGSPPRPSPVAPNRRHSTGKPVEPGMSTRRPERVMATLMLTGGGEPSEYE